MNIKVSAVALKHTDVRGKEQLYLKLSDGKTDHIITVGNETYNKVKAMEEGKETAQEKIDKVKK